MTLMNRLFELFQRRDHEAGQVVVLVTGGMLTLLASVGIVLDVGIQVEQRRQLQNAVDAAAHAGAQMLPDTAAASARAQQYFEANTPTEGTPALSITFPTPDREQIEIVGSLEVQYVVLSLFGKDSGSVSARAVAGAQATDIVLALDRSGSMCRDSHWLTSNCPAPPPDHEPMTSVKAAANGFRRAVREWLRTDRPGVVRDDGVDGHGRVVGLRCGVEPREHGGRHLPERQHEHR